jgi:FkbM family methyltransferase
MTLGELDGRLDQDPVSVALRAAGELGEVAGPALSQLVLYGAGNLGRATLRALRETDVEAVAFADGNPALQGTTIEGLEVLAPEEAARRYGSNGVFVVTIWRAAGPDTMPARLRYLRSLGCERVVTFAVLFRAFPDVFLPHFQIDRPDRMMAEAEDIRRAEKLWSDDASRREFVGQLRFRLDLDFSALSAPVRDEIYFPKDLVRLRPSEVFVDAGAYDGDTLRRFLSLSRREFRRILAFEPDPRNFRNLEGYVASLDEGTAARIRIEPKALAAGPGKVRFEATGTDMARVGPGSLEVETVALDDITGSEWPTFLKMDTEGSEPDVLEGARRAIEGGRPLLAISVYHRQNHLWTLPLKVAGWVDDYRFFLRPHRLEGWDLVCYAVPLERLPGRSG